MNAPQTKLRSELLEWKALEAHRHKSAHIEMKDLFRDEPRRFDHFHLRHEGLLLDFSKQRITQETLHLLLALARACNLEDWRAAMFRGDVLNNTENRAVLHTALRHKYQDTMVVDGVNIVPPMRTVYERMKDFSEKIRSEGKIKHVINIGIGGSDLGASMVCEALKPFSHPDIALHFISNIDPGYIEDLFAKLNPEETLFIVSSKTFTTHETIVNALTARRWVEAQLGPDSIPAHFVGVTQNTDEAKKFGITPDNIFRIWEWVGGRFSLWSAIGLPHCIAIGYENFCAMLDGARSMDEHFLNAPLERNMPVLLAMIGIWNRNFLKFPALGIMPYNQYLHRLPAYMQQLDMESNGKTIDRQGRKVPYDTGPLILGETGTNGQHAFFQLFHQGSTIVPMDFIAAIKPARALDKTMKRHQDILLANMVAQSKALMEGREATIAHKAFEGNRPSTTILLDTLNPYHLGMLLALYEHKIFVQGIIWNINSFDQSGVELGKRLTSQLMEFFTGSDAIPEGALDSSTLQLIRAILSR